MASTTMTLTMKRRWWVPAFLNAAICYAWLIRPFLTDDELQEWGNMVAAVVVKRGFILGVR